MMIRLSRKNDINGIVSLWNEAFGDTEKEIMFFLNNKYNPDNTLIAEENGEIASMLFLLEGEMCIKGVDYPSYYLYAACTAKKYRGRGLMSGLLEEAKRIAQSRKINFICLMPGEKSLFDFYEKHGYKTVFSKKILTIDSNEIFPDITLDSEKHCSYEELRNNAFAGFDYFKWDGPSVKFASDHIKMYSGKEMRTCKGYCLYRAEDDTLYVKEYAFAQEDFEFGLKILAVLCNFKKVIINLPSTYDTEFGKYEIIPSAMLLPVSGRSHSAIDGMNNAYLGLTLD